MAMRGGGICADDLLDEPNDFESGTSRWSASLAAYDSRAKAALRCSSPSCTARVSVGAVTVEGVHATFSPRPKLARTLIEHAVVAMRTVSVTKLNQAVESREAP